MMSSLGQAGQSHVSGRLMITGLLSMFCLSAMLSAFGAEVLMRPGLLQSFDVACPERTSSGQPVAVTIAARDEFGNLKTDYAETGRGVHVSLTAGEGSVSPNTVPAERFRDGVARVEFVLVKAETVQIRIQEKEGTPEGLGTTMVVAPGVPSSLVVNAPGQVQALSPFSVTIIVQDAYRNPVNALSPGSVLLLSGGPQMPISPQTLPADSLQEGSITTQVTLSRSGSLILQASCRDPECHGMSDPIDVIPGPLSEFRMLLPSRIRAGEKMPLRLEARDAAGNIVENYGSTGDGVSLLMEGSDPIQPSRVSGSLFLGGKAEVDVVLTRANATRLHVQDEASGVETLSEPIAVEPSALDHFDIDSPSSVPAGEVTQLSIVAKDAFENVMIHYDRDGKGIRVSASSGAEIRPSFVPANRFDSGLSAVGISCLRAHTTTLEIREEGGTVTSLSPAIEWIPGQAERFEVTVIPPTEGFRAGVPFDVVVEARDRFANMATHFSKTGAAVMIASSGTGVLTPPKVEASQFQEGIAAIQCVYDKAEAFQLTAALERGEVASENRGSVTESPALMPSVAQATRMIEERQYEEAAKVLNGILEADPDNQAAKDMARRLEDILKIIRANGSSPH